VVAAGEMDALPGEGEGRAREYPMHPLLHLCCAGTAGVGLCCTWARRARTDPRAQALPLVRTSGEGQQRLAEARLAVGGALPCSHQSAGPAGGRSRTSSPADAQSGGTAQRVRHSAPATGIPRGRGAGALDGAAPVPRRPLPPLGRTPQRLPGAGGRGRGGRRAAQLPGTFLHPLTLALAAGPRPPSPFPAPKALPLPRTSQHHQCPLRAPAVQDQAPAGTPSPCPALGCRFLCTPEKPLLASTATGAWPGKWRASHASWASLSHPGLRSAARPRGSRERVGRGPGDGGGGHRGRQQAGGRPGARSLCSRQRDTLPAWPQQGPAGSPKFETREAMGLWPLIRWPPSLGLLLLCHPLSPRSVRARLPPCCCHCCWLFLGSGAALGSGGMPPRPRRRPAAANTAVHQGCTHSQEGSEGRPTWGKG